MRIIVDPTAFRYGRSGGSRYFAAVCRGLRTAGLTIDLPLLATGTDFAPTGLRLGFPRRWPRPIHWLQRRLLWRSGNLSQQLFHRRLATGRYDLALITSWDYDTEFLPYLRGTPFLMVVHDTMRSHVIPWGAIDAPSDPLFRLQYLARRAARVICVSEATRRDLLGSITIPAEQVVVVRTGNLLPLFSSHGTPVPGQPDHYLLFVGSRQVRKNFAGAVRALAPLLEQPDGPMLVATGRFNVWEQEFVDRLGLKDRAIAIDADDGRLITLYQHAIGLVYPTFYEGFGLPVLEAMALGCPVITSNGSSLPEVVGDTALLVDPADPPALLHAVTRLVDEPALRARLAVAGRERAAGFSYARMLDEFLAQVHAAARQPARNSAIG